MAELLEMVDKQGNVLGVMERKTVLARMQEDFLKTGDSTFAVRVVRSVLLRSNGSMLIVQRGNTAQIPFLWDGTANGHVGAGESFDDTMKREMKEELGIDAIIVTAIDFDQHIQKNNLQQTAVLRVIDFDPWYQAHMIDRDLKINWKKRERAAIYVGFYDGPVSFPDGEAQNVRELTFEEFKMDVNQHPEIYTHYMKTYIERYAYFLNPVIRSNQSYP